MSSPGYVSPRYQHGIGAAVCREYGHELDSVCWTVCLIEFQGWEEKGTRPRTGALTHCALPLFGSDFTEDFSAQHFQKSKNSKFESGLPGCYEAEEILFNCELDV